LSSREEYAAQQTVEKLEALVAFHKQEMFGLIIRSRPASKVVTVLAGRGSCDGRRMMATMKRRAYHRSAGVFVKKQPHGDDDGYYHEEPDEPVDLTKFLHEMQQKQEASSHKRPRRRLDVAIVGLPNAGKSQLLNVLTKVPVAAVSRKRHTTREGILGARTVRDKNDVETQLLFVDTPGFLRFNIANRERLNRNLRTTAQQEMRDVDFTLIVVDAARIMREEVKASLVDLMLQALTAEGRLETPTMTDDEDEDEDEDEDAAMDEKSPPSSPDDENNKSAVKKEEDLFLPHQKFGVVLNKVDLVNPKEKLIQIATEISALAQHCITYQGKSNSEKEKRLEVSEDVLMQVMPTFFYTDARSEEGVDDVLDFLVQKATPAKFFEVPPGQATIMEPEDHAEEIIREKLYRCLHKEVPYNIRQENRLFRVGRDKDGKLGVVIHQDILVRTKSHKQLVQGTGYRTLDRIHETATRALENLWGCKVALHLHVKLVTSKTREWSI